MIDLYSLGLPKELAEFATVVLLSFILGLEWHNYRRVNNLDLGYGTTRTLTLIGIAGFVLYALDEQHLFFLAGFTSLSLYLGIYYFRHFEGEQHLLLGLILGLLIYFLAPMLSHFPRWLVIFYVVIILIMLGARPGIRQFSDKLQNTEIITFGKFLLMAGVILPLLPNHQIAPFITVTYYQVWLALLVVSSISYLSYLAQTYWLKQRGLLITGLLGGLYSSTATTLILGRRAREGSSGRELTQAVILATVMMYLRLLLLVLILGHHDAFYHLLPLFSSLILASFVATALCQRLSDTRATQPLAPTLTHPLEFKTATLFALLFVVFSGATSYALDNFGNQGLRALSFVVGMTDIDPFILSLLGGKFSIDESQIVSAIIVATASNNLLKALYSVSFAHNRYTYGAAAWLACLSIVSLSYVWLS